MQGVHVAQRTYRTWKSGTVTATHFELAGWQYRNPADVGSVHGSVVHSIRELPDWGAPDRSESAHDSDVMSQH